MRGRMMRDMKTSMRMVAWANECAVCALGDVVADTHSLRGGGS